MESAELVCKTCRRVFIEQQERKMHDTLTPLTYARTLPG